MDLELFSLCFKLDILYFCRIKNILGALTKQIMMAQLVREESLRSEGQSGVKQVRILTWHMGISFGLQSSSSNTLTLSYAYCKTKRYVEIRDSNSLSL